MLLLCLDYLPLHVQCYNSKSDLAVLKSGWSSRMSAWKRGMQGYRSNIGA